MLTPDTLKFFATTYEQVKHTHHITKSYAQHVALGKFYEAWDGLTDSFIETYQGKYGRIEGSFSAETFSSLNIVSFITTARDSLYALNNQLEAKDTDLLNIVADMIGLCNHTLYLLSLS